MIGPVSPFEGPYQEEFFRLRYTSLHSKFTAREFNARELDRLGVIAFTMKESRGDIVAR